MSVVSIVAAERERYVTFFQDSVADARRQNPESASELLISINSEDIPYPYRYVRADLIGKLEDGSDRIYELWLDPASDAEARGFDLGPVKLELYPFTWCAVQFAFDRPLSNRDELEGIVTRWLDVEDQAGSGGWANAIHSATQLGSNGQFWYFTADFGTAPVDAMLDVIDVLLNGAITRLIITSNS